MKLCEHNCKPCCDFCIHVGHEFIQADDGHYIKGGPCACYLHSDEEHQDIAMSCGHCDDFHCFNVPTDGLCLQFRYNWCK